MPMCFGSRLKLFITVSCVCRPRAALLPLARPGDAAHGLPLSARSTVGRTFGVTSLDQITASRQPSWLRSCGLSCHPDCCVMGPTLPREGSKARQSRRLGSASDPGNHWAAIPAALLGLECGDKPRVCQVPGLMETIKPGGTSMVAPRKYPEELRERSIRMTLDARQDPASRPSACRRIGEQLGINPETLRGWVTQAEVDAGARPGTTTAEAARLGELEREVRELRRANAILLSASTFFAAALDRPSR